MAVAAPACMQRIAKNAAAGAVSGLQEERAAADRDPKKQAARVAGERAVEGAVTALDEPEQREAIRRIVAEAVSVATTTAIRGATHELIAELGPDGNGPLAASLSRTSERVSASAVGGVGDQLAGLVPECDGPDRLQCIERRLQQTARTTAASFTSGVKDSIGWQLLLAVFGLGACGGILGAWLWSVRPVRRRTFRTA